MPYLQPKHTAGNSNFFPSSPLSLWKFVFAFPEAGKGAPRIICWRSCLHSGQSAVYSVNLLCHLSKQITFDSLVSLFPAAWLGSVANRRRSCLAWLWCQQAVQLLGLALMPTSGPAAWLGSDANRRPSCLAWLWCQQAAQMLGLALFPAVALLRCLVLFYE